MGTLWERVAWNFETNPYEHIRLVFRCRCAVGDG